MLRFSSGVPNTWNNKSTTPSASCFHPSVFGTPDEKLALVFDLLLEIFSFYQRTVNANRCFYFFRKRKAYSRYVRNDNAASRYHLCPVYYVPFPMFRVHAPYRVLCHVSCALCPIPLSTVSSFLCLASYVYLPARLQGAVSCVHCPEWSSVLFARRVQCFVTSIIFYFPARLQGSVFSFPCPGFRVHCPEFSAMCSVLCRIPGVLHLQCAMPNILCLLSRVQCSVYVSLACFVFSVCS